jgi:hypothetical protein
MKAKNMFFRFKKKLLPTLITLFCVNNKPFQKKTLVIYFLEFKKKLPRYFLLLWVR